MHLKINSITTQDHVIRPPVEYPLAKVYLCNVLIKMECFVTEAVFSCTDSTNMTDNISQETPVSHYSMKQNDRPCNQSTDGQSPVQQNDAITITKLSLPTESCDNP